MEYGRSEIAKKFLVKSPTMSVDSSHHSNDAAVARIKNH